MQGERNGEGEEEREAVTEYIAKADSQDYKGHRRGVEESTAKRPSNVPQPNTLMRRPRAHSWAEGTPRGKSEKGGQQKTRASVEGAR